MEAERHRDAVEASELGAEQEAPEEAPVDGGAEQAPPDGGVEQAPVDGGTEQAPVDGGTEQAPPQPTCDHEDAERQLQQDLEELTAKAEQADEYLLLAQRTQADFENYRKRAAREAALAQERGVAKLVKELLPAIDNLDRALKAASEEQSPIAEGIKLVRTDLLSALQRVGVEPFSPEGEPFDPQLHEAVAQRAVEGAEPGTVAEVFQQGYRLGDSVLRPARVLVAA
jgi:molecular chaperone GrpE